MWLTKETKRLLFEISVGIVLYNILLAILAILVLPRVSYPLIPALFGLFVGAVAGIVTMIHIGINTERVLEGIEEEHAKRSTIIQAMVRKVVLILSMLVLWNWFQMDLLAAVVGMMGMKAGAYLQPFIHRFLSPRNNIVD